MVLCLYIQLNPKHDLSLIFLGCNDGDDDEVQHCIKQMTRHYFHQVVFKEMLKVHRLPAVCNKTLPPVHNGPF